MQPPLFKFPPHHVLTMSTEMHEMQLSKLHLFLEKLPASLPTVDTISQPPSKFDFEKFELDQDWVEMTGSVVGAINHELKIRLGCHDRGPIHFREHGPPVVALVSVLDRYTHEFPDMSRILDNSTHYNGALMHIFCQLWLSFLRLLLVLLWQMVQQVGVSGMLAAIMS